MYMYVEFWSITALGMLNTSGMPYGAGVVGMGKYANYATTNCRLCLV